ncbi:hypothetical protein L5515_000982 [Caenorhabditis briggsae]|uniref:Uncharacterized protein n=1 Tax=Caenorhabditis briggsae TaxID=6238 RepID=A0AAE9J284_CAEBR|nr:hypothetical protein L5515_000982 [Caenorhabditis briggsae]
MESSSYEVAAFADVVEMTKGIPVNAECVTDWVMEKYKNERQLEEKLERMEKLLANREFKLKTLTEEYENYRLTQSSENSDREKELLENIKNLQVQNDRLLEDIIIYELGGTSSGLEQIEEEHYGEEESLERKLHEAIQRLQSTEDQLEITKMEKDLEIQNLTKHLNDANVKVNRTSLAHILMKAECDKLRIRENEIKNSYKKKLDIEKIEAMNALSKLLEGEKKNKLLRMEVDILSQLMIECREALPIQIKKDMEKKLEEQKARAHVQVDEEQVLIASLQKRCRQLEAKAKEDHSKIGYLTRAEGYLDKQISSLESELRQERVNNTKLNVEVFELKRKIKNLISNPPSLDEEFHVKEEKTEDSCNSDDSFEAINNDDI